MKVSEAFPSKYLSATDLQGKQPTVIIESVSMIELENEGRVDRKMLVAFEGKQKGLVLNKTNAQSVADIYGDDTDDWLGKSIKLVTARVDFQGRRVDAIRIDPPDRNRATAAPGLREQVPPPAQRPAPASAAVPDFDDTVPF